MTQKFYTHALILTAMLSFAELAFAQTGPASVFVQPVTERDFAEHIEALGTLEPNEVVNLTLNTSDRVQSIYFDDGQRVRKGKTLLTLAQNEQVALTEAADAGAGEAAQQLERIERLAARNAVSAADLDEARSDLITANAQLRAVQSRQKDRVLVAPFDGILGFRQVSVGSYVRAGDTVARLIDDSEMNLEFSVPSIFLRSLSPGTKVIARTDDYPGESFDGKIATIDNAIDPVSRSVRVRATLPNPERILLSGMFMEVVLTAAPRESLAIPEESVQPIGPKTFVFKVVETDGKLTALRSEVTLGSLEDGYLEVLSGLTASDSVVTEGVIRVRDGSQIKIENEAILEPSGNNGITSSSGGGTSIHENR